MHSIIAKEEPSSLTSLVKKFERRKDLSPFIRLQIASTALFNKQHGTPTELSRSYKISRTFVYQLKNHLLHHSTTLFGICEDLPSQISPYFNPLYLILQLRLIGHSSLSAISEILCNLGISQHSTGYISETLDKMGSLCPSIVEWQGSCVGASDEIFYIRHKPILVTVEVSSMAILQAQVLSSLNKDAWEKAWKSMLDNGIILNKVIMDEGRALQGARDSLDEQTGYQPDTFHSIAYKLGQYNARLKRDLAEAQTYLQGREERYFATKTNETAEKVYKEYLDGRTKVLKQQEILSHFSFFYGCMLQQMKVFHSSDGRMRLKSFATQEVQAAIDLMRLLPITGLNKTLNQIQKILPNLFNFLETAQKGFEIMANKIDSVQLIFWAQAWQNSKIACKIKHDYPKRSLFFLKMQQDIDFIRNDFKGSENEFDALAFDIFKDFDIHCAQSSAPVENINAFLRPFINQSKGQISQNMINLLMFYHNHKVFKRGKRKGFAPIELLSGKKLNKSWLDLLAQKAKSI
jgi:hypothetical protein